jgi:hypothetical protein
MLADDEDTFDYYHKQDFEGQPTPDDRRMYSFEENGDFVQLGNSEYPQPDIRGPMPKNAHPDSTFSSHLHNDWTLP